MSLGAPAACTAWRHCTDGECGGECVAAVIGAGGNYCRYPENNLKWGLVITQPDWQRTDQVLRAPPQRLLALLSAS